MEKFQELSGKYNKYVNAKLNLEPLKEYDEKTFQDLMVDAIKKKQEAELYNMLQEHKIMKRFIVRHGLWETFLNDDEFLKYLREDYTGE